LVKFPGVIGPFEKGGFSKVSLVKPSGGLIKRGEILGERGFFGALGHRKCGGVEKISAGRGEIFSSPHTRGVLVARLSQ